MGGDIAVWLIVGGVVLLVGRRFIKILKGHANGCGCGGGGCPRAPSCDHSEGISQVREDAE